MPERIALVTGATGFLGGHVAAALVSEGWRVRALVRSDPAHAPLLRGLPLEFVVGDLSATEAIERAASGCAAIVHLAGVLKARTLEEYREGNRAGTARLVAAARRAAPRALFVAISSQAAAGPARAGTAVGEADPPRPISWYGVSKREAEDEVRTGWPGPWLVLRPGVVYGPGDRGLLPYFRLAERGWLPVPAARSRIQIDGAGRVAIAIARAAGRPDLAGRTGFLCAPEPVTLRALAAAVAALRRPTARLVPVPDLLVRLAGAAETIREAVSRRSRPFNADKAREILAGDWLCVPAIARDLALPEPSPLALGLAATRDWYLREGWLAL